MQMSNDKKKGRQHVYYDPTCIIFRKRRKKGYNIVPREKFFVRGRISVHMGDKSLLQGIFRASLKEIGLPDLGEEKEEAEYRVKYGILNYALLVCTGTLKV